MTAARTQPAELTTVVGTPFAGGIYAGRFFVGAQPYALIVAPADPGELVATTWGGLKKVTGALSYSDGLANTEAMAKAGSKAAQWAQALFIGDFDDWYVPSRLELLIAFGELGDLKVFEREWYWSSTQCASDSAYAWYQYFANGLQYGTLKTSKLRARAVRRLAI